MTAQIGPLRARRHRREQHFRGRSEDMKTLMIGALTALVLLQGRPAQAELFTAVATLGGGEETPAALLTGAVGTAVVVVDTDLRELAVSLRIFNLPTGTTAGHIHVGPKGVSGPVVLNFPIPAATDRQSLFGLRRGPLGVRRSPGDRHPDDRRPHPGNCRGRRVHEHSHVAVPRRRDPWPANVALVRSRNVCAASPPRRTRLSPSRPARLPCKSPGATL